MENMNTIIPTSLNAAEFESTEEVRIVSKKNKKRALFFFFGPTVLFIVTVLFGFLLVVSNLIDGERSTLEKIIVLIIGISGLISVLGIIVGTFLGVYFANKKEFVTGFKHDKRSGNFEKSIMPEEIRGVSFPGFLMPLYWGLYHGVWISLLTLIPFLGFGIQIYLLISGKELAWRSQKWESVEVFKAQQKQWTKWTLIIFLASLPFTIFIFMFDIVVNGLD